MGENKKVDISWDNSLTSRIQGGSKRASISNPYEGQMSMEYPSLLNKMVLPLELLSESVLLYIQKYIEIQGALQRIHRISVKLVVIVLARWCLIFVVYIMCSWLPWDQRGGKLLACLVHVAKVVCRASY